MGLVHKSSLDPTYRKDNGLWNLTTETLCGSVAFTVREQSTVYVPAGAYGGNHLHPRQEAFIGIGQDLYLVWQDDDGAIHEERMMDGDQLYACSVAPHTPHAVINRGNNFAVLIELADGPNVDVRPADVLKSA